MRCLKCNRKACKPKSILPLCHKHQKEADATEAWARRTQLWDAKRRELEAGWYTEDRRPLLPY